MTGAVDLSPERALEKAQFGSSAPHPGAPVTSNGFELPTTPGSLDDQAAIAELEHCDWDDPLTRLLLLLEIADRPAWLREVARTSRRHGPEGHRAG
jgi:hypothetical protein